MVPQSVKHLIQNFSLEYNLLETQTLPLILFLIFISVDSERDACLKRNSASMTCVSSSNSTSLGRECDINGAVGSDQVNTLNF